MAYANGKWFKSQGKIKCSPFFRWMNESFMVSRSSQKHRVISKITSPLVHRAVTWPQVGRLHFWWYDRYLLLLFSWRAVCYLSGDFQSVLDGPGLEEPKRNPWCFSGSIFSEWFFCPLCHLELQLSDFFGKFWLSGAFSASVADPYTSVFLHMASRCGISQHSDL